MLRCAVHIAENVTSASTGTKELKRGAEFSETGGGGRLTVVFIGKKSMHGGRTADLNLYYGTITFFSVSS